MVRTVRFIERRRHPRRDADGLAQALSSDAIGQRVAHLELTDLSDGGLSGETSIELSPAQRVTILLPARTDRWTGRVVRCDRASRGYHVAVAFDQPRTSAG